LIFTYNKLLKIVRSHLLLKIITFISNKNYERRRWLWTWCSSVQTSMGWNQTTL